MSPPQSPPSYPAAASYDPSAYAQTAYAQPAAAQPAAYSAYGQPAAAASAAPPGMRPSRAPWALGIAAAITALVALFTTWYSIGLGAAGIAAGAIEFSLFGCSITALGMGLPCSMMAGLGAGAAPSMGMLPSLGLMAIGLLLLLFIPLAGFMGKMPPRNAGFALLGGSIASIVAPVVLLLTAAGSFNPGFMGTLFGTTGGIGPASSFWGSTTTAGGTITWGPGIGWYAAFVAGGIGIAAAVSAITGKPGPVPATPAPAAYAAYGYPPTAGYPPQAAQPGAYGYGSPYGAPQAQPAAGYAAQAQQPAAAYAAPAQQPTYAYGSGYAQPAAAAPATGATACPYCGGSNPAGTYYCAQCGRQIGG